MTDPVFKQVKNPDGSVGYVEVQGAASALASVGSWAQERALEPTTHVGVVGGVLAAPSIMDNLTNAVLSGMSGNYIGCVTYGIPALVGIAASVAAIVTPEKSKGVTDDQIKAAVAGMSRDDLMQLLSNPAETSIVQQPIATAQRRST